MDDPRPWAVRIKSRNSGLGAGAHGGVHPARIRLPPRNWARTSQHSNYWAGMQRPACRSVLMPSRPLCVENYGHSCNGPPTGRTPHGRAEAVSNEPTGDVAMGTRGPSLPVAVLSREITVARPCRGYWVLHVSEEAEPNLQGFRLVHDGNISLSDAGCIK